MVHTRIHTQIDLTLYYIRTKIVPPVCNLSGFNKTLWTMKFGKSATGGTSVTAATFHDHYINIQRLKAYHRYVPQQLLLIQIHCKLG